MQERDPRDVVSLEDKLRLVERPWHPRILAELNGQQVKVARLEGRFDWHSHAGEDELFLVLEGRLAMHYRDRTDELGPGQLCVVPRGVEHCPEGLPSAGVLLFEPSSTLNTGDGEETERTVRDLDWI